MQQTSKAYFFQLTILHGALLLAQLMFVAVAYYVNSTNPIAGSSGVGNLNEIFQYVVPIFILVSYIGSSTLSKIQLKPLKEKTALPDKLIGYRAALIVRYALLEVPSLFSIVCFLETGNYFYLALAALVMIVFFLNRPTLFRTVNDLELTPADRTVLENPDAIVI